MQDLLPSLKPELLLLAVLYVIGIISFFSKIKRKVSRYNRNIKKITKPFTRKKKCQNSTDIEVRQEPYFSEHQNNTEFERVANEVVLAYTRIEDFPIVKVAHVIDGDTVIVNEGRHEIKIRLDSIDCPECDQHWGDTATYGLIKLIGGRNVHIEEHGLDRHERTLATIYVQQENGEWINVNERMVTLGHAWVLRKFYNHLPKERQSKLNQLERWARSKKVGLWSTPNPVPPWEWRCEDKEEIIIDMQDDDILR